MRHDIMNSCLLLLGGFLVAAAMLKCSDLSASGLFGLEVMNWQGFWRGIIAWEFFLGMWLMSGSHRNVAVSATLATFSIFTIVSGYGVWLGVSSCRCLGVVTTSPLRMMLFDIVVVGFCLWERWSPGRAVKMNREESNAGLGIIALGLVIPLTIVLGFMDEVGSRLRGEIFRVEERAIQLGEIEPGGMAFHDIRVRNVTNRTRRIIGGTHDCTCHVAGLPVKICGDESAVVRVLFQAPTHATPGLYHRTVLLYTDDERQPTIRVSLACPVR